VRPAAATRGQQGRVWGEQPLLQYCFILVRGKVDKPSQYLYLYRTQAAQMRSILSSTRASTQRNQLALRATARAGLVAVAPTRINTLPILGIHVAPSAASSIQHRHFTSASAAPNLPPNWEHPTTFPVNSCSTTPAIQRRPHFKKILIANR
jgi:hypothetical protein